MPINRAKQSNLLYIIFLYSDTFFVESIHKERSRLSLLRIGDSFKKIIIQRGYMKPRTDDDGIIRMGIINFLLDDTIL